MYINYTTEASHYPDDVNGALFFSWSSCEVGQLYNPPHKSKLTETLFSAARFTSP